MYINSDELYSQAVGLKDTAETMIKSGHSGSVQPATQKAAEALVEAAKQMKPHNPVIASLHVRPEITWPEVLTIANAVFKA